MRIMLYDNCKRIPPELAIVLFGIKPRMIGFEFKKELIPDRFGTLKTLTFYFWKWYRNYQWI